VKRSMQMAQTDSKSVLSTLDSYFASVGLRLCKNLATNTASLPYIICSEIKTGDTATSAISIIKANDDDAYAKFVATGISPADFSREVPQTQEVLSVDYISASVCAAKVRFQIGPCRYTSLLSILKSAEDGWKIVSDVTVRMDMSRTPPGALFTPGRQDEEDLRAIVQAAQDYIDGNHGSDVELMRKCMHPSTHLFSVDQATGSISSRACEEYFQMMTTRAPSFASEVVQYDKIFKVGYALQ
jgi:Putative lumazine-binding